MATILVGGEGNFATIQEAVNSASDGDVIVVSAGTYIEQVQVDGFTGLTIQAASGAEVIIKAPENVVETGRTSSDREISAVVTVENSSNVVIQGLTVDGDGKGNTVDESDGAGAANYVGVFYRNASGSLLDVDVTGVRDPYEAGETPGGNAVVNGVQRGVGVQVDNDAILNFTMTGGSITDFQKNATVFNKANLNVTGVTVTGNGDQTIIAQNGIQVLNSTGTISGNTITAIGYAGPAQAYSGAVLAYGNTDLNITNNTIIGANDENTNSKVVGIFVFESDAPNSGGSITGNVISFVDEGIDVTGSIAPNTIAINSNTVTNIDEGDQYAAGVYFDPLDSLTTTFSVDGTGVDDIIFGAAGKDKIRTFDGDDYLDGRGGIDVLDGGAGNDTYGVDNTKDKIKDSSGIDTVEASISYTLGKGMENLTLTGTAVNGTGNSANNVLTGNELANRLAGSTGNDFLTGGEGADSFFFDSKLVVTNIDTITDFEAGSDIFVLENKIFKGLAAGDLDVSAFVNGVVASGTSAQILYSSETGQVLFDRDGAGTKFDAVQFATVEAGTELSFNDFNIV